MSLTDLRNSAPMFDGYESVAELLEWIGAPEPLTERAGRITAALQRSPGFRNFYKYISERGTHLEEYAGIIVRRSNEYRWGSTPSMEFWEDIYKPTGWLVGTGNKRVQLVQQLEETWGPEQALILQVLNGRFELSSRVIPLFSKGVIKA